ncbi:porin family protein [Rapidithrix thailandica]|uniref:Porin family protein n=1 Tax=Rapidithrix thailandica TaxID=413964 RepID=A0AAW9RVU8_9BACT
MKRLITLILCLACFQFASAQVFKMGVKGGLNTSNIRISNYVNSNKIGSIEAGDAQLGYHLGLMARVKIPVISIYVQPELLLTSGSNEFKTDLTPLSLAEVEYKYKRLDIPVLLGFKFGPARINAGPVYSRIIHEKWNNSDMVEPHANEGTWGFQGGMGVDILKKLALDFRYETNLSKFGEGMSLAGEEVKFDSRSQQWILSLGVYF